METTQLNLMEIALHDYEAAREELNRPEHDVVTHSVCQLTRKSLSSMLRAYLDQNNVPFSVDDTMENLVQASKKFNPALSKMDFDILACSQLSLGENPANYCISEARVNNCFRLLHNLKETLFVK